MRSTSAFAIFLVFASLPLAGCQRRASRMDAELREARSLALTEAMTRTHAAVAATRAPTHTASYKLLRSRIRILSEYNRRLEQAFYDVRNLAVYVRDRVPVGDDGEPVALVDDVIQRVQALTRSLAEIRRMAAALKRDFRYPQSLARPADELVIRMAATLSEFSEPAMALHTQSSTDSAARQVIQQWMTSAPWERLHDSRKLFNEWASMSSILSEAVAEDAELLLRPPTNRSDEIREPAADR